MNKIQVNNYPVSILLKMDSNYKFHEFLIGHVIERYVKMRFKEGGDLGNVLIVCGNYREASFFQKFPFKKILITGIVDESVFYDGVEVNNIVLDERVTYEKQNCENISFESQSFDLVFCKEGLHHLARPVLGLYEMLRVCSDAVIFVEPFDSILNKVLCPLGLSSSYEINQPDNVGGRSNFVYRWTLRQLQFILNSYYLRSGYHLDITLSWLTTRFNLFGCSKWIRKVMIISGWIISHIPGFRGNNGVVMIRPGNDIPVDPKRN